MSNKVSDSSVAISPESGSGPAGLGWPMQQPGSGTKYYLTWLPLVFVLAPLVHGIFMVVLSGITALFFAVAVFLGLVLAFLYLYTLSWTPNWKSSNLYTKLVYVAYQRTLSSWKVPRLQDLDLSKMKPKKHLVKNHLAYALNLEVPRAFEEEFGQGVDEKVNIIAKNIAKLPMTDTFETFRPDENPVEYVMSRLGTVFPPLVQQWDDKLSDEALTRFCLYGLTAHRIEVEHIEGVKYYVVRTNTLSLFDVRKGLARYGGDCYFTEDWRVSHIIDNGYLPVTPQGQPQPKRWAPGEPDWDLGKFRFRSSALVLVTIVDHLYAIHMQFGNLVVTSVRENLCADHPVRRFLLPFTYNTIAVNAKADHNLVKPGSLGPRTFAFTDHAMDQLWAAAPRALRSGSELTPPTPDTAFYIEHLKQQGIDTEYNRQASKFWTIMRTFVDSYLQYYYPTHADMSQDQDLMLMMQQILIKMQFVTLADIKLFAPTTSVEEIWDSVVNILTKYITSVTQGHEQVGSIGVYTQDASWCCSKWAEGQRVGTKQAALIQGLIISLISTPMPRLLGTDWTNLFLPPQADNPRTPPTEVFATFQAQLKELSAYCLKYNEEAKSREFPENSPLYCFNPDILETSVSV